MGLFEAHEEKKSDVRVVERARLFGRLDKKANDAREKTLVDEGDRGHFVNVDELNARDNPVHMARNLPSLEAPVRRNIEDAEFDNDEANRGSFEQ
ncbi:MAG TPA: hypothetical protein VIH99_14315 [Bdellovibrionota bacterium]|jgi:hypothetical protein